MQTQQLHITNLQLDPFNPRRTVDSEKITKLADLVRQMGIIPPLVVRRTLPAGVEPLDVSTTKYGVICGSRRLAAARLLGLSSVPAVVHELSDAEAAAMAVSEQDSVESLHFVERADHFLKWRDAGVSADEIGERTGMKRATVYAIIALAEKLTPEAREECFTNRLNETTARKLATVPPSAQTAALKKLLEPGFNGPKTTREAEEVLESFRRDLTKAPFDPSDETLLCCEHKGACDSCPLRSGFAPELFAETVNPDLCTSPDGYASRASAAWARLVEDGAAGRGPPAMSTEQSDKYFDDRGVFREDVPYVLMDAVAYEDLSQRTYRQLVRKAAPRLLVRHPRTLAVLEVLDKAQLPGLLEEHGKIRRPEPVKTAHSNGVEPKLSAAEKREQAEKEARREKVRRLVIGRLVQKVESREPDKKWWRSVADALVFNGGLDDVWARRDVQNVEKYLDKLDGLKLRGLVYESIFSFAFGQESSGRYPEMLLEQAKALGVDVKEVEREVVAEEKAQPKVEKGAKK